MSRGGGVSWVDAQGHLWLFGGFGFNSVGHPDRLNDLWRFNPATNEWTWISGSSSVDQAGVYGTKGTADPLNVPGARNEAASWTDATGRLWLFGGVGYDSAGALGSLNDLWNFSPATMEWTWVSGSDIVAQAAVYGTKGLADPLNVPGAREVVVSWIDAAGNLWLFGGEGRTSAGNPSGYLNDLWRFDPQSLIWTWMSGSNIEDQAGIYGIKGTADPSNVPGARRGAATWIDSRDELWLFGGHGLDSASSFKVELNDLWKFDPVTLEWTWMSGSDSGRQSGVYGRLGAAASSNVPGGRAWSVSWIDTAGKLWLFGGQGISLSMAGHLNDLWMFDPINLEWTWMSGSPVVDQEGVYGTKGVASPLNVPGARAGAFSWADSQDRLWLFGGWALSLGSGANNDLWRYTH